MSVLRFVRQVASPALFFVVLMMIVLIVSSPLAFAFDDDEEISLLMAKSNSQQVRQRLYPGARDEQELEVQEGLPAPTRTYEAPGVQNKDPDAARD